MGMIIGKKIKELMQGYPTISDKYNVDGGYFEATAGSEQVEFGAVLSYGSATGHYTVKTITSAAQVAGILIASNVKLATTYPAEANVKVVDGDYIGVMTQGGIAVVLADSAVKADIKEGAKAYVTADGKFTTVSTNNFDINAVFTGVVEATFTSTTTGEGAEAVTTTTVDGLAEIKYNLF